MPEATPQPPPHPAWENGWAPDTSRAPGTRRLWLAGTLAIATVVACVTAIAVGHNAPDKTSSAGPTVSANTDNGPGLLSFASPSASNPTSPPKGTSGMSATSPTASTSATATATSPGAGPKSSPSGAKPSKSTPAKGTSGGSGSSGGSGQQPGSSGKSVRSVNYPDRYWHVSGSYVYLDQPRGSESREDSTFELVKGLANASCYSFATHDGLYLRHQNFVLRAESNDGSGLFQQDATFCPQKSPYSDDVLFQSVNYPNYALRHKNFQLRLDPYGYNTTNRQDFFFDLVDGLS
ncbi:AbfB domain-containing protein [Streptomyces sp. NPDC086777]|uniref:AbfB domain-containing protein n=1 Tax=Streptomyces sp. NPDC086777 TaxID=3154866 RepID=UPI00344FC4D0